MNAWREHRPNILLILWDACRFDYAVEHAEVLSGLAESNIWFERAIAPSPWSLPSHASIFTGEYPHEHGCHRLDGSIDTDLVQRLSERGYRTVGISANGFASQRTGFHEGFDEFYYTGGRERYPEGMDVSGFAQRNLRADDSSRLGVLGQTVKELAKHPYPVKSTVNLLSVGCGELADTYEVLQRIPHPVFSPDSGYCYAPERNTGKLESVLHRDQSSPFFVFMNYMDTHRPYKPRSDLQEKHLGTSLSFKELRRVNERVAYPWEFIDALENGELDEDDVQTVRRLYAGEVETVDEHLGRIRVLLEDAGLLEDTILIVTSDHGENLGEVDERGWRRMGHEASVSEAVLHVPLLVAHPGLDGRTVHDPVSLKDLYELVLNGADELVETGGESIPGLLPFEGVVASQYPATGGQKFFTRHPEVSAETIKHRVSEHTAVAYDEVWKVIAESTGERWAGEDGGERQYGEAPELLVETVEGHLARLEETGHGGTLSQEDISQLEALGYL